MNIVRPRPFFLMNLATFLLTYLLLFYPDSNAPAEIDEHIEYTTKPKWFLTAYSGIGTHDDLTDVVTLQASFHQESYIGVIALGRELWRYQDLVGVEVELQAAKHFGAMNHWEFNVPFCLRWYPFFWDDYLDTSFAVGYGLSYATDVPELEEENSATSVKFMNYLLFELGFSLAPYPQWDFIIQLHHRSGGFDMFGTSTGSNFVCVGLKYNF